MFMQDILLMKQSRPAFITTAQSALIHILSQSETLHYSPTPTPTISHEADTPAKL